VPEWVEELGLEDVPSSVEVSPTQEGETEIPNWLQEAPPEETVAETSQEPPSRQISEREDEVPTIPAWMQEMYAAEEEAPSAEAEFEFQEEALPTSETPAWLDALRAEEQAVPEKDSPVETAGPLAGLRGLLNPEPMLGILPKSAYKPVSPVPETHLKEAKVIEQILSAPPVRLAPVSKSSGQEVMANLGRWIIYAAILTVIMVGIFVSDLRKVIQPPQLPETQAFYNAVEELSDGGGVLVVLDYDASLDGELMPQARAILSHLVRQGMDIVAISLNPQGVVIAQDLLQENLGYAPDKSYVNLGYLPPHPASLQAFVRDPFAGTTLFGQADSVAQTALGQRVRQFDDLDLVIMISGSQDHVRWWIEQVGSQRPVPVIAGVSAAVAPYVQPYYSDTGNSQLGGMLIGLAGAAEYEELLDVDIWPSARENLSLQGYVQFILVLIVLLSSVSSVIKSMTKRAASRAQAQRSKVHTGGEA
jgi:hypothetical protein